MNLKQTLQHYLSINVSKRISKDHFEILVAYLNYKMVRGHSMWTIYRAAQVVSEFMQFLESNRKSVSKLTAKDVEDYYSWLLKWNSLNCLATKSSYIKPFIRWLASYFENEYYLEIWRKVKTPKRSPKKLPIPDDDMILEYLKYIDNPKYRALFALLAETGLRLGESLALRPRDIIDHGDHYEICVIGEKTGEVRSVYVVIFYDYVKTWINRLSRDAKYVFYGSKPDRPLARSAFRQYLKRVERRYNLPHIWPHLLRHYNAVRLLKLGMSEKEVREIHGWKTPEIVDRYAPYLPYLKDKYLRLVGLKRAPEIAKKELKPIICLRCGAPLSQRAVLSMSERLSKLEKELRGTISIPEEIIPAVEEALEEWRCEKR